jgi:hypothetical protein
MKKSSILMIAACAVLAGGVTANAQPQNPYDRDGRGYGYDRYGQPRDYRGGSNQRYLFDRVMRDVNQAAQRSPLDGHERHHVDAVFESLQQFQSRWARGKFDTGKLDRAIENLDHLARADRVRGYDRERLYRDVQDLRQFRANRGYGPGL